MESFHHDTPLASFLEGEGQHERQPITPEHTPIPPQNTTPAFAPVISAGPSARLLLHLPPRLHIPLPSGAKAPRTPQVWHRLTANFGYAENAHFLEHFRYTVIASQLLEDNPDPSVLQAAHNARKEAEHVTALDGQTKLNLVGAAVVAGVAFASVWLISWIKSGGADAGTLLCIALGMCIVVALTHLILRRHAARHIQDEAVQAAQKLVTALQSLELAANSALALAQEVELIAKGFRYSTPLPPISRVDNAKSLRRCMPLRRQLFRASAIMTLAYSTAHDELQKLVTLDDYEKFLDVYDVPKEAVLEAMSDTLPDDLDREALAVLRILGYRSACLRRAVLCDMLSIEAGNDIDSRSRWREATKIITELTGTATTHQESLEASLRELEEFVAPPSPRLPHKHNNDRLRTQIRKITTVSSGIRALQAKMTLLREESNAALAAAEDLTDLGPTLMSQYESIGADIHALQSDWEHGKTALTTNITRHERRISLASFGDKMSPVSSTFSGLTAVGEGTPADALRALNGDGRSEGSHSPRSSMLSTPSDEEVFEAVALPMVKKRSSLTRDERIRLVKEERVRAEERREARESGMCMMRELRSVINVRKRDGAPEGARVTSI